ncbi:hypothetical protein [Halorussus halobius]|uniref:hypothetical protein n=1 Tax=Halorussus halobius TaxID=1710537 RepID=UPI00109265B4|nr:hypothetical protein [Halorussus halobius]
MATVVATLAAGIAAESTVLVGSGAVLLVGFPSASTWLADRLGHGRRDERTRRLTRTATSRAVVLVFVVAFVGYLLGSVATVRGGLSGPGASLYTQARTVLLWVTVALTASGVVHGVRNWLRRRRLET